MIVHGLSTARPTTSISSPRSTTPRPFESQRHCGRHYSTQDLLVLAAAKDAGFTTPTFVDALNAIRRLTNADWAEDGIATGAVPELHHVFTAWPESLTAGG